jgi:hypothetical protein
VSFGLVAGRDEADDAAGGDVVMPVSSLMPVAWAFASSALTTGRLLGRGRLRSPRSHVGRRIVFADGTSFRVYRETVRVGENRDPSVLVVRFRLPLVGRSRLLHALFRAESLANTPLFAGFPGFRTKLWLTDERTGEYRGLYDWDGPGQAEAYATTLGALLRLVCSPGSVAFHVQPGADRDDYLHDRGALGRAGDVGSVQWWAAAEREPL